MLNSNIFPSNQIRSSNAQSRLVLFHHFGAVFIFLYSLLLSQREKHNVDFKKQICGMSNKFEFAHCILHWNLGALSIKARISVAGQYLPSYNQPNNYLIYVMSCLVLLFVLTFVFCIGLGVLALNFVFIHSYMDCAVPYSMV